MINLHKKSKIVEAINGIKKEIYHGITDTYNLAANILYPNRCPLCYCRTNSEFCNQCIEKLPLIKNITHMCTACCHVLRNENLVCEYCATSTFVQKHHSAMIYNADSSNLICRFKYNNESQLANSLGKMLFAAGDNSLYNANIITFVPVHRFKYLKRNFNQAEVLAKIVGDQSQIPVLPLLEKTTHTARQATLSAVERKNMSSNQYICAKNYREKIYGSSIILIDDVCTTGATLNTCTIALHKAGAQRVLWLTLATTLPNRK